MELIIILCLIPLLVMWLKRKHRTAPATGELSLEIEQALRVRAAVAYLTSLQAYGLGLLASNGRAGLEPINPTPHNYRLVAGEELLAAMPASLLEVVATGASTSFRSYDNTGYHHREMEERVTAVGKLLITTHALVFQSDRRNDRLLWGKISNVDVLPYSFKVHKRQGRPMTFGFTEHDVEFAKAMIVMANPVN